jgi:hypothetical protein
MSGLPRYNLPNGYELTPYNDHQGPWYIGIKSHKYRFEVGFNHWQAEQFAKAMQKELQEGAESPEALSTKEQDEQNAEDIFSLVRMIRQMDDTDDIHYFSEGRAREFVRIYAKAETAKLSALVEQLGDALKLARNRVDVLGAVGTERDFNSNVRDYLPQIDKALAALAAHKGEGA